MNSRLSVIDCNSCSDSFGIKVVLWIVVVVIEVVVVVVVVEVVEVVSSSSRISSRSSSSSSCNSSSSSNCSRGGISVISRSTSTSRIRNKNCSSIISIVVV